MVIFIKKKIFLCIFLLIFLDQITKFLALNVFIKSNFFCGFLKIILVKNRGAAFGIFKNSRWFFIIFAAVFIISLIYYIFKKKPKDKLFMASYTLVLSGAIGNLIDRIIYGYVIDFLQLYFFAPVCNFADYYITFGTILFIFWIIKKP